jgi:hypothetical protein
MPAGRTSAHRTHRVISLSVVQAPVSATSGRTLSHSGTMVEFHSEWNSSAFGADVRICLPQLIGLHMSSRRLGAHRRKDDGWTTSRALEAGSHEWCDDESPAEAGSL